VAPEPLFLQSCAVAKPFGNSYQLKEGYDMRIGMIGSGYVGLVSGACFADFGHHVVCVDKDADKISALKAGRSPIFEPGLTI
jgi:UDP-N-acetyl-D-mannosaminuronate dehydrogenase